MPHFSEREMVLWLFWRFLDKLQTLPSSSPREAAQGRNHHGADLEVQNQLAFATNVCSLLGCVVGHGCHGTCPTGSMSYGFTNYGMSVP